MSYMEESFTFTVGKLDAGMAILIGDRAHLIEFPSLLLPPGVTSGSIVNISVNRNVAEEKRQNTDFWQLQKDIYNTFGVEKPIPPKIELRNVTQTSVTLEWPKLNLATAKIRSLDIYRNGVRLAAIPSPLQNTSTKLSGLEVATDYSFHLVLRTTAGTFNSNIIRVKTHTIVDTSGISVCFGDVPDGALLEQAKDAIGKMKAKWSDKIQIDTTHFVCSTHAGANQAPENRSDAPGVEYQRALQLSIPVVQPQWVLACFNEKTMVPISKYYLGATPPAGPSARPQSMIATNQKPPSSHVVRHSLPSSTVLESVSEGPSSPPADKPPKQPPVPVITTTKPDSDVAVAAGPGTPTQHKRAGTMTKDFKFPAASSTSPEAEEQPPLPEYHGPPSIVIHSAKNSLATGAEGGVELPPLTPEVGQQAPELRRSSSDDDLGETVEVDLS